MNTNVNEIMNKWIKEADDEIKLGTIIEDNP